MGLLSQLSGYFFGLCCLGAGISSILFAGSLLELIFDRKRP